MNTAEALKLESIPDVKTLEDLLSEPTAAAVKAVAETPGDFMLLGVGGKMGPTLARMILRAAEMAGTKRRVVGVSRFGSGSLERELNERGVETVRCDLLDRTALNRLPEIPNIVYMAGMKFGSEGKEALTWAMNCYLPGMVCERFPKSRIVAFSTGNVYGLVPVTGGGSVETDRPNPLGDYAMSCLGREMILEHFSRTLKIPMAIVRLNYATETRYGVLVDIAQKIRRAEPIDLAMGCLNALWQADANAMTVAAFSDVACPPFILNEAGPELLRLREVAEKLAARMGKKVTFTGTEAPDALLSNGRRGWEKYGYPRVGAEKMIEWIAEWTASDKENIGKPTHFETRNGKY